MSNTAEKQTIRSEKCSVLTVLTRDLVNRLDDAASRRTASRSFLIREACEKLLQESEQKAAA